MIMKEKEIMVEIIADGEGTICHRSCKFLAVLGECHGHCCLFNKALSYLYHNTFSRTEECMVEFPINEG